ncbi:Sensor protein ZraS [Phycisphaerales bacterium]|nr:Sensor protein ZraS [Phycisphaerales bacterium]
MLSADDLAGLMASFNEVTAKLQTSHDALRSEVARLTSELSEANAQLERSRRLAALGEMAAGIAHEVRNPLGSIRLYAKMLEEDLPSAGTEHQTAVKIGRAVRAVEGIVGDVLSFAREFRLRSAPVEVPELFDRVVELCGNDSAAWRRVEIVRRDRSEGACPVVVGDPPLLQQALVNVVRNAVEAMAEAPCPRHVLTLDARERRVSDSRGRGSPHAVLSVRDTGPGVAPDVVARMFNPFFTTRGTGTGLGLAIVHRIVDAHVGRVVVRNNSESGEGPGACIELVLPLRGAPESSMAVEASTASEASS